MQKDKVILIVEDSVSIRQQIEMSLEKKGYITRAAGSEIGMMQAMEEYGVMTDLIIMDITLRFENGFDLIERLKKHEKYSHIPVLILTRHSEREMVLKAKSLGIKAYLRKPFHQDDLIGKIEELIP